MRRSIDRILTTHVGSLARPLDLLEHDAGEGARPPLRRRRLRRARDDAVAEVVAEQVKAGLDVVTDGEIGKVSFLTYVKDRLGGLRHRAGERLMPPSWQVEIDAFPEYYADYLGKYKDQVSPMTTMVCTGPGQLRRARAAADRHRQPPRGARGPGDGPSPRRSCPPPAPAGFGRNEYYAELRRVPRRRRRGAARGVPRRSSTPGSCCRSTTRG